MLRGDAAWWRDTSNGDEVETGTEPGAGGALAAGWTFGALDAELEAGARWHPLHGRNRGDSHRTADGRELILSTLTAGLYPRLHLADGLALRAGGGAGVGWLRALGDDAAAPCASAGAGVLLAEHVEIGWRWTWCAPARVDGYEADYEAHSVVVGWRW